MHSSFLVAQFFNTVYSKAAVQLRCLFLLLFYCYNNECQLFLPCSILFYRIADRSTASPFLLFFIVFNNRNPDVITRNVNLDLRLHKYIFPFSQCPHTVDRNNHIYTLGHGSGKHENNTVHPQVLKPLFPVLQAVFDFSDSYTASSNALMRCSHCSNSFSFSNILASVPYAYTSPLKCCRSSSPAFK